MHGDVPIFEVPRLARVPLLIGRSRGRGSMHALIDTRDKIKLPLQTLNLPDAEGNEECGGKDEESEEKEARLPASVEGAAVMMSPDRLTVCE